MTASGTSATSGLSVAIRKLSQDRDRPFQLDVDFAIPAGITILFGASGAGKTTLLDCISGLRHPDEGRVTIGGSVWFDSQTGINIRPERRRVGYLFQSLAIFPHMTVAANIEYGLSDLSASEKRFRVDEILASFHIAQLRSRKPGEISGGERQRVALARALVTHPRVLLLDEPLTALDAVTKARIVDDLRAWNQRQNIPILYVTHDREEVYALGERALVMDNGRLIAQGLPQDVLHRPESESVAQLVGFENIFDCTLVSEHPDLGTMTCRIAGSHVELEAPLTRLQNANAARVGVRAGDILVAAVRPEGLSARNIIPGTIVSLEQRGPRVDAVVDCGLPFRVQLTPGAKASLSLEPGRQVWLVIKTYSCHVLQ